MCLPEHTAGWVGLVSVGADDILGVVPGPAEDYLCQGEAPRPINFRKMTPKQPSPP